MSLIKEFRDFAVKGNVVDLAVGVIIGNAFGKVVSSLVDKILTPPLGYLIGGVDFPDCGLFCSCPVLTVMRKSPSVTANLFSLASIS